MSSIYDDPDGLSDWMNTRYKESGGRRKTVYKKGETIRTYKNRTLHIHHPQTDKEWKKASKLRRSKAAKGRTYKQGYEYADPFGLTTRQTRPPEYYQSEQRKKQAAGMGIEDMRALLRDEHWEEVCHHSRWKWDNASTIKEYNRYLMEHRSMY